MAKNSQKKELVDLLGSNPTIDLNMQEIQGDSVVQTLWEYKKMIPSFKAWVQAENSLRSKAQKSRKDYYKHLVTSLLAHLRKYRT